MSAEMRLLVCGGRTFSDVPRLWAILDGIDRRNNVTLVIDGAQQQDDNTGRIIGADYWAHQWALARNKQTLRFLADWDKYGKAAGPKRNRQMFDEGTPTHGLAMPGNRGTAHMVGILKRAKIPVMEVKHDR